MDVKHFDWDRWIQQIAKTQAYEISCTDCLDHIAAYVETRVAGTEPAPEMAAVGQHLEQCRVCREEYVVLRDLVEMDEGRAADD